MSFSRQWLASEDIPFFKEEVGLVRTAQVDPARYCEAYFSTEHVAYVDGYDFEKRILKYRDAVLNIRQHLFEPVLDIGCGPGYIVEGLRRSGAQDVCGVDISRTAISELSLQATRPFLYEASLTSLPFETARFESGYSFHVLEHLVPAELDLALAEISRVVKTQLYLIIPTWESLTNWELFHQIVCDPTHRIIVTREWWIERFSQLGWVHNNQLAKTFDRINRGWVFFFER